jgi:hypothetical protein
MRLAWLADWMWGLPLTALTIMIHVGAVIGLAAVLTDMKSSSLLRGKRRSLTALRVIIIIGMLGWILAALHGFEAIFWAAAFMALHALPTFPDAILYSIDSLTTRGESGLRLEQKWKLLGALEASDGVLLFGISTAFLFAVAVELRGVLGDSSERRSTTPPRTGKAPER